MAYDIVRPYTHFKLLLNVAYS